MNTRINSNDHGLILLKLKNELEEPHKIELQSKNELIDDLKR
jgi:hypothetical protein